MLIQMGQVILFEPLFWVSTCLCKVQKLASSCWMLSTHTHQILPVAATPLKWTSFAGLSFLLQKEIVILGLYWHRKLDGKCPCNQPSLYLVECMENTKTFWSCCALSTMTTSFLPFWFMKLPLQTLSIPNYGPTLPTIFWVTSLPCHDFNPAEI